jgi:hypothetical protein
MYVDFITLARAFRDEWRRHSHCVVDTETLQERERRRLKMTEQNDLVALAFVGKHYSQIVAGQRAGAVIEIQLPPPNVDVVAAMYEQSREEVARALGFAVQKSTTGAGSDAKTPRPVYRPVPEREEPLKTLVSFLSDAKRPRHFALIAQCASGMTTLVREAACRMSNQDAESVELKKPINGVLFVIHPFVTKGYFGIVHQVWSQLSGYDYWNAPEPWPPTGKSMLNECIALLKEHNVHTIVVDGIGSPFHYPETRGARHLLRGIDVALASLRTRLVFTGCVMLGEAIRKLENRHMIDVMDVHELRDSRELRWWITAPSVFTRFEPCTDDVVNGVLAASKGNLIYVDAFIRAADRAVRFDGVDAEIVRKRLIDLNAVGSNPPTDSIMWRTNVETYIATGSFKQR